jgi:3-hydroxyacyl-CoA dehydrogenase
MVEAGHLGAKSGVGFYDYSKGMKEAFVAARFSN